MQDEKCKIPLVLDDLKYIHQRDKDDALGAAEKQWQQLEHEFDVEPVEGEFENIVYAAMGGSALAALLSKSWPGYSVPFEVVRDYNLPAYVSGKTLIIVSSYSGNTEETLSALEQAEKTGAKIAAIASGGKLADIAKDKGYSFALLPKTVQPRYAVLSNLKAILALLNGTGLLAIDDAQAKLKAQADFVKQAVASWLPTVPKDKNPAKKLAYEMAGKSVIVYAGPLLAPVAYKWKINCNENAKHVAWWNQLPEFDHNELMGWSAQPIEKPYTVIELRSHLDNPRIQKRFEVGERLLSGSRPAPEIVEVQGKTPLEQILWALAFGDFTTMYLALLNNVNPGTSEIVEKFKKALG